MNKKTIKIIIALSLVFTFITIYSPVTNLPESYKTELNEIEAEDDIEFIKKVSEEIDNRFTSERYCWINNFGRIYLTDATKIFRLENKCLPCHVQTKLLKASLLESKRFTEEELEIKTLFNGKTFHVYLRINLDGKFIDVDQWGRENGIEFGEVYEG